MRGCQHKVSGAERSKNLWGAEELVVDVQGRRVGVYGRLMSVSVVCWRLWWLSIVRGGRVSPWWQCAVVCALGSKLLTEVLQDGVTHT